MQIDSALTAAVGLIGSLVGGASTCVASWLTHRGQLRAQMIAKRSSVREALYAEFIVEASKRVADAWSRQAESPAEIAALYSAIERMRLTSSAEVIVAADNVIRQIVEAYAAPDQSFDDLRHSLLGGEFRDPIRHFSEACRKELNAFGT
jgi:hypothetical protein